jgi:hypothetical protein
LPKPDERVAAIVDLCGPPGGADEVLPLAMAKPSRVVAHEERVAFVSAFPAAAGTR